MDVLEDPDVRELQAARAERSLERIEPGLQGQGDPAQDQHEEAAESRGDAEAVHAAARLQVGLTAASVEKEAESGQQESRRPAQLREHGQGMGRCEGPQEALATAPVRGDRTASASDGAWPSADGMKPGGWLWPEAGCMVVARGGLRADREGRQVGEEGLRAGLERLPAVLAAEVDPPSLLHRRELGERPLLFHDRAELVGERGGRRPERGEKSG